MWTAWQSLLSSSGFKCQSGWRRMMRYSISLGRGRFSTKEANFEVQVCCSLWIGVELHLQQRLHFAEIVIWGEYYPRLAHRAYFCQKSASRAHGRTNRANFRIEGFTWPYEPQCLLARFAESYWGLVALQYLRPSIAGPSSWTDSLFYSKVSKSKSCQVDFLPSRSMASFFGVTTAFSINLSFRLS